MATGAGGGGAGEEKKEAKKDVGAAGGGGGGVARGVGEVEDARGVRDEKSSTEIWAVKSGILFPRLLAVNVKVILLPIAGVALL